MAGLILVLNSGSSTLKASLVDEEATEAVAAVTVEWTGERESAIEAALQRLDLDGQSVRAVAHRVVHGGARLTRPVVIDDDVVRELEALTELAPIHNSVALETLLLARRRFRELPHVACFDTAFHATLPEEAWRYPVPYDWAADWGVRRFGFHGLSVEWSVRSAAKELGRSPESLSLVVAHLGNGCSVTAVSAGRSVWTSMGLTPFEGLMMGTRSGSIDPGLILHLVQSGRLTAAETAVALERQSGLLGVSGVSGDMREVRAAADAGDERARLAIRMFVARAAEAIAMAMTWVTPEAVVFTGGIGEHDDRSRVEICDRLPVQPPPRILVIEAREDLVMARAAAVLALGWAAQK